MTRAAWRVAPDRVLALDHPVLMGILNATPDSFSDGGAHGTPEALAAHGVELVRAGAAILDVGGESTRPGAARVDDAEQIRRTRPVIERLRDATGALISIDTTRAEVARAALDCGATIVNDVSGGTEDPALLPLVAERGCGVVLMHRLRPPEGDVYSDAYEEAPDYGGAVVAAVGAALAARVGAARATGVAKEAIAVDPGLGFGKSVAQNFALIRGVAALVAAGRPVLGGASRKSVLGAVCGVERPADRRAASLAAAVALHAGGVRLFRVHDVAAHREALAVADAVAAG